MSHFPVEDLQDTIDELREALRQMARRRELLTAALAAPDPPQWWLAANPLDFTPEPKPVVPDDFKEAYATYRNQLAGYSGGHITDEDNERAAQLTEAISEVEIRNRDARRRAEHRRVIDWRMCYALELRRALEEAM